MRREAAIHILNQHDAEQREVYGVKSLALFGSVARGEATPASDVDMLVEFDPGGFIWPICSTRSS